MKDELWPSQYSQSYWRAKLNLQLHPTHAMSDTNQRLGHLALKLIDERQKITSMIPPARFDDKSVGALANI